MVVQHMLMGAQHMLLGAQHMLIGAQHMLLGAQHMLRVVQHMCGSVRLKLSQLPTKLKLKLKMSLTICRNRYVFVGIRCPSDRNKLQLTTCVARPVNCCSVILFHNHKLSCELNQKFRPRIWRLPVHFSNKKKIDLDFWMSQTKGNLTFLKDN